MSISAPLRINHVGVNKAINNAIIPTDANIDSKLLNGKAVNFLNQLKSLPHLCTRRKLLFFNGINNKGSLLQSSKSKAVEGLGYKIVLLKLNEIFQFL